MCGNPIEGRSDKGRGQGARGKPVHPAGQCPAEVPPARRLPRDPAAALPRTRGGTGNPCKSPNTRAVPPATPESEN
ncbi:hypothetical protein GCM10010232_38020 [Streptomyces amakusaensis]